MLTRLFASLFCLTMAGSANAEIAMDGDSHFGLFSSDVAETSANDHRAVSTPSFQQPRGTRVTLRGNGRFGLLYQDRGDRAADVSVNSRLRLDIDVSHEIDSGVTIGGQVRAQSSAGSGNRFNQPRLSATWN